MMVGKGLCTASEIESFLAMTADPSVHYGPSNMVTSLGPAPRMSTPDTPDLTSARRQHRKTACTFIAPGHIEGIRLCRRARDHRSGRSLTAWRRRQRLVDLIPAPAADTVRPRWLTSQAQEFPGN